MDKADSYRALDSCARNQVEVIEAVTLALGLDFDKHERLSSVKKKLVTRIQELMAKEAATTYPLVWDRST